MVLQTAIDTPSLLESTWYCLDLYNDAAHMALYFLNSQVKNKRLQSEKGALSDDHSIHALLLQM